MAREPRRCFLTPSPVFRLLTHAFRFTRSPLDLIHERLGLPTAAALRGALTQVSK